MIPRYIAILVLGGAGVMSGTLAGQVRRAIEVDTLARYGPAVYDRARQRAVMVRQIAWPGFGTSTQHDLVAWDGGDWVPILPPIVLPQTVDHVAYDGLRDRILVLGGTTLRTVRGTEIGFLPTVPMPSPSFFDTPEQRRLVHDEARDEVVVFGGSHTTRTSPPRYVAYDQTYVLRGGVWQEAPLASRPPARDGHALVYDPLRRRTVLFGGGTSVPLVSFGDTWEWDGFAWTQVAVTGPAAGGAHGTYDPTLQRVVVIDARGDVWAFDGSAWTPLGAGTPRPGAWLAFDGNGLLASGHSVGYLYDLETLRWNGATWNLVSTSVHMHASYDALMAYDTTRDELLCVHVNPPTTWIPTSTWTWNGRWTRHAGTTPGAGALAFDQGRGQAVLFGGWTGSETWTWNGSAWTQRTPPVSPPPQAPPPQQGHRLAYDPIRDRTVMHGAGGTWLWDGTTWAPSAGPQPPSVGTIFEFDPSRGAIVTTGGLGLPTQTWEWNGQWQLAGPTSGLASAYLAAFDPLRGRLVAFENTVEHAWNGTAWIASPASLPYRLEYARAMETDLVRRRLLFRGVLGGRETLLLHVLGDTPSLVEDLGGGCASGIALTLEERPAVGATAELVASVAPLSPVLFGFALQSISAPLGACTLRCDGSLSLELLHAGPTGRVEVPLAIPAEPWLRGASVVVQAGEVQGGQLVLSRALRLSAGD
ncbi:MAG: hypothetical protein JNM84_23895 [Planctomycetes bacterium]|nr:hypothetical protein [Planctomycetota bacterium]